jgi:hypothetical protein
LPSDLINNQVDNGNPAKEAGFFVELLQSKRAEALRSFRSPVAVMPVTVMPTAVPAPMPVTVPTAMPVMVVPVSVTVTVMVPAHFFWLDMVDVVLRYDGRFGIRGRRGGLRFCRHRWQRCSLRASGKHGAARDKSYRQFQKVPAFHEFSPFLQ